MERHKETVKKPATKRIQDFFSISTKSKSPPVVKKKIDLKLEEEAVVPMSVIKAFETAAIEMATLISNLNHSDMSDTLSTKAIKLHIDKLLGNVIDFVHREPILHVFSHQKHHMNLLHCCIEEEDTVEAVASLDTVSVNNDGRVGRWMTEDELGQVGITSCASKILARAKNSMIEIADR